MSIVILGAGYAGMMSAVRLAHRTRKLGVRITLVNPSDRFVERLRMHQTATGQKLGDHRIPDVLAGTGIEFVRGAATAIDPDRHTVTVDNGQTLDYDTLVYALGSRTDTSTVPGVAEHAYTLNGPLDGSRFAARLAELRAGTVAVCGGGLTGIEAATEIADSHPDLRVTLVSTEAPGAMMGPGARAYLDRGLARLGVTVRAGVRVAKVLPDGVELETGELVAADACLWTAGVTVSRLAAESGIAVDERGLVLTDRTLRSVSHPDVYAVGDAAAVRMPWGQIHGTCQSGIPTGAHVADTIARLLRGKPARPFHFGYVHQPVSLGRSDGVIQFTRPDDTPRRWYLRGRAAVAYKEMVSSSPVSTYRFSRFANLPVTLPGGRRER